MTASRLPRLPSWFAFSYFVVAMALFASLVQPIVAQDEEDDDQPYRPGLIATYEGSAMSRVIRIDDAVQFDWASNSPDGRLPAGPFKATWQGELVVQSGGKYHFFLHGVGTAELSIGGKVVVRKMELQNSWAESEWIDLPAENQPIELAFEKNVAGASIGLYWSGPGFLREPISPRFFQHDRQQSPSMTFQRGDALSKALRCAACHREKQNDLASPAPALDRLRGNLDPQWMIDWLTSTGEHVDVSGAGQTSLASRRMPHFGISKDDAAAITAWLQASNDQTTARPKNTHQAAGLPAKPKTKDQPTAELGERLALTLGCIACHQIGELGQSGLFGGGDLTKIAAKRPADFFSRWLSHPAELNRDHRMPVFDLSDIERESLALYLQQQKPETAADDLSSQTPLKKNEATLARGKTLVAEFGCASCHRLPAEVPARTAVKQTEELTSKSNWKQSCLDQQNRDLHQPGYRLAKEDAEAVREYFAARIDQPSMPDGRWLLVEQNCLACHTREGMSDLASLSPPPLPEKLTAVAEAHAELSTRLPALTPPSLNSVGDKLHDTALAAAIRRPGKAHRTYLQVRMPKFRLSDEQLKALTGHLIAADRIPPYTEPVNPRPEPTTAELASLQLAGSRLVTTDGFGCTSCHTVGGIDPPSAPANARGPELALMHERLRREWYDRWVRNPARIVPRMEMPSVQLPVRGVLHDNIDQQLSAVWHVLSTPGFKPPDPNPVRVLRRSGDPQKQESAITLNDVIKSGDKTWLFPLVVGLPNRHNAMFDLEHNRLARWWIGDMARQRTKGKTWFWEQGGSTVFDPGIEGSELSLIVDGKEIFPEHRNQFLAALQSYGYFNNRRGITFLSFIPTELDKNKESPECWCEQFFGFPGPAETTTTWDRVVSVDTPQNAGVKLRLIGAELAKKARWDFDTRTLHVPGGVRVRVERPTVQWHEDGTISHTPEEKPTDFPSGRPDVSFVLHYISDLPADQYLAEAPPDIALEATEVAIAPGISGKRLPLPPEITPTGLAWSGGSELVFTTLKGEVFSAWDSDKDGHADKAKVLADGLATPYGLKTGSLHSTPYIDIITKTGLLRLLLYGDRRGPILDNPHLSENRIDIVAAGWGYTEDYHDWTVGLPRDNDGNYYIGIPCQQDNRSAAAAMHRGEILKLVPRRSAPNDRRKFDLETFTHGHRFPMGLALRKDGELFVTDNQGNYNPFNELNHVKPGAHFGFINAIEKKDPEKAAAAAKQPLAEPAVNIPHPWTRSVNGICFLETPEDVRAKLGGSAFGPFEGHLVGCEYDTRRLIRMTVEEVSGVMQGAAYPLSIDPPASDAEVQGLLGPIVCAVSPRGELYVGNIRDSGWGAGNNIGEIVRVRVEPEKLPCGIAEVKAAADGFVISFVKPIDAAKGGDAMNYTVSSYRRESTPAYGGPDLDRQSEKVEAVRVLEGGSRVHLRLPMLRRGFVYEIRLKNVAEGGGEFFPAEAHYTLHAVP